MIELSEMIGYLRAELIETRTAGLASSLVFEIGAVELEATMAVSRDISAGGKVKFWIIELGSELKIASEQTQRIKLTLTPRDAAAETNPTTAGRSLKISGPAVVDEL